MSVPKKPPATFEVVVRDGGTIVPEDIPPTVLGFLLSAVQRLASGLDVDRATQVPQDKAIGLLGVKRGSAVFQCVAHSPTEAIRHLRLVGSVLKHPGKEPKDPIEFLLNPVKDLSGTAKALKCEIVVRSLGPKPTELLVISEGDWDRIAAEVLREGDTTLSGKVVRVGGATSLRCALRLPDRDRLLYCSVDNATLARKLGQLLYGDVAVTGKAQWLRRSWKLVNFTIKEVIAQSSEGTLREAFRKLRLAGGDAWDTIDAPGDFIKGLRE